MIPKYSTNISLDVYIFEHIFHVHTTDEKMDVRHMDLLALLIACRTPEVCMFRPTAPVHASAAVHGISVN